MKKFNSILTCMIFLTVFASFAANAKVFDYTTNNKIELLHDSEKAAELKLDLIRNAKHHIHIVSYYLDNSVFPTKVEEELKKAHERGVEVRILSTLVPTLVKDVFLKTKTNFSVNDGGAVFSYLLLKPQNNILFLNNLHEKIFLVDGEKVIIGGRNLSDNSFRAKDMEALIEGDLVNQVQSHFLELFNLLASLEEKNCRIKDVTCRANLEKQKMSNSESSYFPIHKSVGNIKARLLSHNAVLGQIEKKFNFKQRISMHDDIIDAVTQTNFKQMRAYNYFILPTYQYQKFLFDNQKDGKDIKIITNSLKTASAISNKGYLYSLPTIENFLSHGIEIYQWQGPENLEYLHEKVIVFDNNHVFLGSHNFGTGSTSVSNEIAIEFYSEEVGGELIKIYDEELLDSNKTLKADTLSIAHEISTNLKTIKILRETFIGDILEESY